MQFNPPWRRDLTAQIQALEQQLLQEEQVEGLQAQVQQFDSYIAQGRSWQGLTGGGFSSSEIIGSCGG